MQAALPKPLSGPPPEEVPLPKAPLVRVIAQVRFPPILAIGEESSVAKFQEQIRDQYPILERQQVNQLIVNAFNSPEVVKAETIWRFHDKAREWRVSLGTSFVALETLHYTSRKDFFGKLEFVLTLVEELFGPAAATRIGVRYVDRIRNSESVNPEDLINSESLGIVGTELGKVSQHIFSEAIFPTEEGAKILTKWGRIPANATIDPDILAPDSEPSWILDLDMFSEDSKDFSAKTLTSIASKFSERIYSVFRWMTTPKFLEVYGGKIK